MTLLDLTQPMQTREGGEVKFVGELSFADDERHLIFEFKSKLNLWTFATFTKNGKYYREGRSDFDIINIPQPPVEIKVDHFYWTKNMEVVKIVYPRNHPSYKWHGMCIKSGIVGSWTALGKYYNNSESPNDLIRELTVQEVNKEIYGKEWILREISIAKMTNLTREEMLMAFDAGKIVKWVIEE